MQLWFGYFLFLYPWEQLNNHGQNPKISVITFLSILAIINVFTCLQQHFFGKVLIIWYYYMGKKEYNFNTKRKWEKKHLTPVQLIALTSNVGNIFHTLESSRTMSYMIMNEYLDPKAQEPYLGDVNWCVEHVQVVQEVIPHNQINTKTAHIKWFDIVDTFGSLSHMLHVLAYYHFPETIINYIRYIYSKPVGKVISRGTLLQGHYNLYMLTL